MEVLDNKCPACGAKIEFNPKNQMWDCEYCGSKFTLEDMQKYKNASTIEANQVKKKQIKTGKLGLDIYHCKNCGAEVMADETTTATFCVYCGSTAILKDRIEMGEIPTKIIPFKKVKEDAISAFKNLAKGKPLMPKLFNQEENIKKITGVYIPFWIYDLNVVGDVCFNSSDVRTWSDYDYRYVETRRFLSEVHTDLKFSGILVDGSSRFNDDLMDSLEPFQYNELVPYNHAYLSGFLAEKYDVSSDKAIERASNRAMNSSVDISKEQIHHQNVILANNNLAVTEMDHDYILLPVWMVNIQYKEQNYTFAMNGQTGEIVGDIPIDVPKAIGYFLVMLVTFTILFFLIGWFL